MRKYLKVNDVCDIFGVDRTTIYSWIRNGMPSYKVGGVRMFVEADVDAWVMKKDSDKRIVYDPDAEFINVPDGIGKFVSFDGATGMVTVEMEFTKLVEYKASECSSIPKKREEKG